MDFNRITHIIIDLAEDCIKMHEGKLHWEVYRDKHRLVQELLKSTMPQDLYAIFEHIQEQFLISENDHYIVDYANVTRVLCERLFESQDTTEFDRYMQLLNAEAIAEADDFVHNIAKSMGLKLVLSGNYRSMT